MTNTLSFLTIIIGITAIVTIAVIGVNSWRDTRSSIPRKLPPWYALEVSRNAPNHDTATLRQALHVLQHYSPQAYPRYIANLQLELARRGEA